MLLNKIKARFELKYVPEPNSGCWLWNGAMWMQNRYGAFWINKEFNKGKMISAHVASLFIYKSMTPKKGQEVCHKCDVTICVNPNHLFIGSHTDNMRDMSKKGRASNSMSKLTPAQINEARLLRSNKLQVKDIALIFKISNSHMSRIVKGVLPKNTVCKENTCQ